MNAKVLSGFLVSCCFSMLACANGPPPIILPPFLPGSSVPSEIRLDQTETVRRPIILPPLVNKKTITYSNATEYLGLFLNPLNFEVGDEIQLGPSPGIAKSFRFEYFGSGFNSGGVTNEEFRIRFYRNDGAYLGNGTFTPNTVFYDTGWQALEDPSLFDPSGRATYILEFVDSPIVLPSRFTWSIQFYGIDGGEVAGLPLYQNGNVGTSEPDFWLNKGTAWELRGTNGIAFDFAATLVSTPVSLQWNRSGNQIVFRWPITEPEFQLQEATNLYHGYAAWVDVTNVAVRSGEHFFSTNNFSNGRRFFRLKAPVP